MMKTSRIAPSRSSGFGLIAILLLMGLVVMLAASVTTRVQLTLANAPHREAKLQADYAANAGLHRAMVELTANPDWEPTSAWTGTLSTRTNLGYRVEVVNNRLSNSARSGPDGITVPPGRVWMRSTGTVDGEPLGTGVGQAEAFLVRPEPVFNEVLHIGDQEQTAAVFGLNDLKVDSYVGDPPVGTPPPFYTDYLTAGDPPKREAVVWRASNYSLGGGSRIDADLASPLTNANVTQETGAVFHGQVQPDTEFEAPLIFRKPRQFDGMPNNTAPTSGAIPPGCYGPTYTSGDITLSAGTYYFERFVQTTNAQRIDLDSSVSSTSPCVVYVGNVVVFGDDALVNMNGPGDPRPPRHLQIYCTQPATPAEGNTYMRFGLRAQVSGVIAGQGAGFNTGGSDEVHLFGALYVNDAMLADDMSFHYDSSLKDQILAGMTEWVIVNQGNE